MSARRRWVHPSLARTVHHEDKTWREAVSVLDIARGAYVRSPKRLRDAVSPALSLLPVSFQYGKTYRALRAEIARSRIDAVFTERRRLEALRGLIGKAHAGSPFHRERIEAALGARIDVRAIGFDALAALPILTKDDVRNAGEAALAVPAASLD